MGIKNELSKKNPYWIEIHRYLELKHFCLQFPIWQQALDSLDGLSKRPIDLALFDKGTGHSDPTERCAAARTFYKDRISMVVETAKETSPNMWTWLVQGVTEDLSYNTLKTSRGLPCCKDVYYDLYHKFFYILNKKRN